MADLDPALEERFDRLSEQVGRLSSRVDALTHEVEGLRSSRGVGRASVHSPDSGPVALDNLHIPFTPSTFLTGTAFVCFILVIALSLRTVVDNQLVGRQAGTLLGLAYAMSIILYGYRRAARRRQFASLSVVCGLLLIASILIETRYRFEVLPVSVCYGVLAGAMVLIVVCGLRFGGVRLLNIALPGLAMTGIALDFPDPSFLQLAALVALANVVSHALAWNPKARSLGWSMFTITMFFWFVWTVKIRVALSKDEPFAADLTASWFLPILALFAAGYLIAVVWAGTRSGWPYGIYETILPVMSVTFLYTVARLVMLPWGFHEDLLGAVCLVSATGLLLLVAGLSGDNEKMRQAASAMSPAIFLLLAVPVRPLTHHALLTLIFWSLTALIFSLTLAQRLDPLIQGVVCLFQTYICLASALFGAMTADAAQPILAVLTFAGISVVNVLHYDWLHSALSVGEGGAIRGRRAFAAHTVLLVLVSAIFFAFGSLRIVLFSVLSLLFEDTYNVFQCGQSLLLNGGALVLAVIGLKARSSEIFVIAVLMATLGALKVFAFDLLNTQGLPLVVSVFAFGLTATLGSVIWNRWQRLGI